MPLQVHVFLSNFFLRKLLIFAEEGETLCICLRAMVIVIVMVLSVVFQVIVAILCEAEL